MIGEIFLNTFFTKKKIFFIILFILIVIVAVGAFIFFKFFYKNTKKDTYSEYSSYLNIFSIKANDIFEFKRLEEYQGYELILESEKYNSSIYISSFDCSSVRSIDTVINADKSDFCTKFENIKDISEISNGNISDNTYYEYHFSTQDKFIQVYYIVKDNKVYVFDFYIDINKNYEYNLKDYIEEIIKSFKIINKA